jgi:ABC-type nitrate/sulfonate/bicarbonate transport system substrate-binding protein
MLKALWLTILLILSPWPASLAAQERYLISYNGFGMGQAPVWATKDLGLFAKYGLNTDVVMISGSAPATQALVGGSTHFAQTDGTALITAISQGADLVLVAASVNKFPFSLVAQKISASRRTWSEKRSASWPLAAPTSFPWCWLSRSGTSPGHP